MDVANVKDHGAVGDGVADDTAAISTAINSSNSIYFPPGTYLINGQVSIPGGYTLLGAGKQSSIIKTGTTTGIIKIGGQGSSIAHLGFGCPVIMDGAFNTTLHDCRFQGLANAITVQNTSGASYWSTIMGCDFRDCQSGISSKIGQMINALSIIGCTFFNSNPQSGSYPIDIEGSDGISLMGCQFQNIGPRFSGCNGVLISGGYYEAYSFTALSATSSSLDIRGVYWPGGVVTAIDHETFTRSRGVFPPAIQYNSEAEIVHNYANVFPDPGCSTQAATNPWVKNPDGSFQIQINNNYPQTLSIQSQMASAAPSVAYSLPAGISGAGVYCKLRATQGRFNAEIITAPISTDPSPPSLGRTTIDAAQGWTQVRLAVNCDPRRSYRFHLTQVWQDQPPVVIEISELIIVPYKALIGTIVIPLAQVGSTPPRPPMLSAWAMNMPVQGGSVWVAGYAVRYAIAYEFADGSTLRSGWWAPSNNQGTADSNGYVTKADYACAILNNISCDRQSVARRIYRQFRGFPERLVGSMANHTDTGWVDVDLGIRDVPLQPPGLSAWAANMPVQGSPVWVAGYAVRYAIAYEFADGSTLRSGWWAPSNNQGTADSNGYVTKADYACAILNDISCDPTNQAVARRIYRQFSGQSEQLVGRIGNNTDTGWVDGNLG